MIIRKNKDKGAIGCDDCETPLTQPMEIDRAKRYVPKDTIVRCMKCAYIERMTQ